MYRLKRIFSEYIISVSCTRCCERFEKLYEDKSNHLILNHSCFVTQEQTNELTKPLYILEKQRKRLSYVCLNTNITFDLSCCSFFLSLFLSLIFSRRTFTTSCSFFTSFTMYCSISCQQNKMLSSEWIPWTQF